MSIDISFDDVVEVEEMNELMRVMEEKHVGNFAPSAIFHYPLRDDDKEWNALNCGINITARNEKKELVGYMRVVTDFAYIYYIVDVMVHPDYQGQRIGSNMVTKTLDTIKEWGFIKILLTAIPGKEEFYKRMGFKETMSPVLALRGEDYVK